MAKKKSEANTEAGAGGAEKAEAKKEAAAKKPAAKGGGKKGAAKKPAAAPAAGGSSMIDTDLAAQNAARMLAARAKFKGATGNAPTTGGDSASFKQLKESVSNPTSQSSLGLNKALGPQKTHLPVKEYNQIFHNQTQGGVARINVPRRTGG